MVDKIILCVIVLLMFACWAGLMEIIFGKFHKDKEVDNE